MDSYYAIGDVWNVYNTQKVSDIKRGKCPNRLISKDDEREIISRKYTRKLKYNFPEKNVNTM